MLEAAHEAWVRMAPVRARRRRYTRYTYGDQWSDAVTDNRGRVVAESELMAVGGRKPLSNNLIRRMVKAVVGRYRMAEDTVTPTAVAEQWRKLNSLDEVDARTLEEFLISGMAIHHVWAEQRPAGKGVWVDNVSPDRFFINAVCDSRAIDTELVGRLIDMSIGELLMRFAHGDRNRATEIRALYDSIDSGVTSAPLGDTAESIDFYHAAQGRCRVVEVWTLECRESLRCHDMLNATFMMVPMERSGEIDRLNNQRRRRRQPQVVTRWEAITTWHCRMFAPDGSILDEFDSPLQNGQHPFAVKLYPLVDGDIHSLVEDVIDQQRYVNRLITLMDRMMGTAAKGVLLFPTGCKVEGQTWQEVADKWADPGGVIPYRPYQGAEPHQVVTPMADFGARDLLQTQIKLFEDVSGVSDALLGKASGGIVGVDRYESEVKNASVAVSDLLKTYRAFIDYRNSLMAACSPH